MKFKGDNQMPWWLQAIYFILLSPLIILVYVVDLLRGKRA